MTDSSPVISSGTVTMMKLSSGTNSSYTDNTTGGYTKQGNAIDGTHYYPGWYPNTYPVTTGYTCPNCGVWVYNGNSHYCKLPTTVIYQPVYVPQPPTDLTPLLEKLDELTKEIKKLRKGLQNDK